MDEHLRNCSGCRGARNAAWKLRSTQKRLGKHERRLLLEASAPGNPPNPIYPPGPSQSEQTATRRAVANLVSHGLMRIAPEQLRLLPGSDDEILRLLGRKYAVVRIASRTWLGEEVVRLYRRELQSGDRIRWIDHLDEATEAALARCPERTVDVRPPAA
jgi:hypothetical protein